MTILVEPSAKLLTIIYPKRLGRKWHLKLLKCHKTYKDKDCPSCQCKLACAVYLNEPKGYLTDFVNSKAGKRRTAKPRKPKGDK